MVLLRGVLRHRRSGSDVPVRLLYSSRTPADVIYHCELGQYRDPAGSGTGDPRSASGLDRLLGRVHVRCWPRSPGRTTGHPLAFVCRPTRFVETVAGKLVALRYPRAGSKDRTVGRDLVVTLDGNAVGGLLQEVFGTDMTDSEQSARPAAQPAGRRDGRLPTRTRDCDPLPELLRHAHGHLADPCHELRRPRQLDCARSPPGWLTSAGNVLVRSGRPIRRGPDGCATRTPGIHAGPGTRRRQPSPPLPGP